MLHSLIKKDVLFKLLVFFLPVQVGYHLWPKWSFIAGVRSDYLSPTFYLTDVIVILLVILGVNFNLLFKSTSKQSLKYLLILIIFIAINIVGAISIEAAIFKWLKVLELFLLVIFIIQQKTFNFEKVAKTPFVYSLIIISIIGISQFLLAKTTGLFGFLGERRFNINTPGISLVSIGGKNFLRSYSTFSHPNSAAGYLLVALCLLVFGKKISIKSLIEKISILLSMVFFILTFSRSGYLTIVFLLPFIISLKFDYRKVIKKTLHILLALVLFLNIFVIFTPQLINIDFFPKNISERIYLNQKAINIFIKKPINGVGLNNFIASIPSERQTRDVSWFLQPPHNLLLLILSEVGIIGLFFILKPFILSIYNLYKTQANNKSTNLIFAIFAILLTGVFDHYWFTLQQNQLLLSIVLGLSLRRDNR